VAFQKKREGEGKNGAYTHLALNNKQNNNRKGGRKYIVKNVSSARDSANSWESHPFQSEGRRLKEKLNEVNFPGILLFSREGKVRRQRISHAS